MFDLFIDIRLGASLDINNEIELFEKKCCFGLQVTICSEFKYYVRRRSLTRWSVLVGGVSEGGLAGGWVGHGILFETRV